MLYQKISQLIAGGFSIIGLDHVAYVLLIPPKPVQYDRLYY